MREIKTRVWVNGEPLFFDSLDEIAAEGYQCGVSDFSDAELFTGLTDVNGVEIYEGDVVSIDLCPMRKIVDWRHESGCFVLRHHPDDEYSENYFIDEGKIEVIGNIHQNPELLK